MKILHYFLSQKGKSPRNESQVLLSTGISPRDEGHGAASAVPRLCTDLTQNQKRISGSTYKSLLCFIL